MSTLCNLTPHVVRVVGGDGATVLTVEPSADGPARVTVQTIQAGIVAGVPVVRTVWGAVTGLPAPEAGSYYIVSRVVAEAARDRDDLLIPDDLVRDAAGAVIGCRRFGRVGAGWGGGVTGADLRARRQALGLNQVQLAALLGVPQSTVARWERDALRIEHGEMLTLALEGIAARQEGRAAAPGA